MDARGPLDGSVMVMRSLQHENATISQPKLQVQLVPPLQVQNADIDSVQQQNLRLKSDLEAVGKERDDACERIDTVLNDLIAVQIELEEERQASMYKDAQINQLKKEILRLSESLGEGSQEISELERHSDQLKPFSNEALQAQSLELPEKTTDIKKDGALMQHNTKTEPRAKEMELQEGPKSMAELEFQHQSDMVKLQDQLDRAQAKCLENQRKWEMAEAKVEALQEAALLQSSQAGDVADMEELLEFYQTNAESVSKRAKETMDTNKQLEALIVAKDKQLNEQVSLIMTIRQHTDPHGTNTEQPMIPGSFY